MFSFLSTSSIANISKVYCRYYYIMALIVIFSTALLTLGLMGSVYSSLVNKREKLHWSMFAGYLYAVFVNLILIVNFRLLFAMCSNSIQN
jgi:hypothetical protein